MLIDRRILLTALVTLFAVGCAHSVHEYHVGDHDYSFSKVPESKKIESMTEQFVIMGFVTQTDYVNEAYDKLKAQCPGVITGIQTRYSTSLGFFSWTNKIKMVGYCSSKKS